MNNIDIFGEFISTCHQGDSDKLFTIINANTSVDFYTELTDFDYFFVDACASGYLDLARMMKNYWPQIDHRIEHDAAFRRACRFGHLDVAQWLKSSYPDINHTVHSHNAFRRCCENGHVDIAKWLVEISIRIDSDTKCESFVSACNAGQIDIAEWLLNLFPDLYYSIVPGETFESVCKNGQLLVAQWFVDEFELSTTNIDFALQFACQHGHLELTQWLTPMCSKRFLFPTHIFVEVCQAGHLTMAQWMMSSKFITDKKLYRRRALVSIIYEQHDIVQWLITQFKLVEVPALVKFFYVNQKSHNYVLDVIQHFDIDDLQLNNEHQKRFDDDLIKIHRQYSVKASLIN